MKFGPEVNMQKAIVYNDRYIKLLQVCSSFSSDSRAESQGKSVTPLLCVDKARAFYLRKQPDDPLE